MADWKKIEQSPDQPDAEKKAPAPAEETVAETAKKTGKKSDEKAAEKPDKKAQKEAKKAQKEAKKAGKAEKRKAELLAYAQRVREKEAEKRARYDKKGRRRGRFNWAPAVGFVMSLLAVIGAISLVFSALDLVRGLTDDTVLREEMYYYLQPIMAYNPFPQFDDANAEDMDELLQAAVWRITDAERIRMLREKDDNTAYELDASSRLVVPVQEVVDSYQYLFGKDAVLNHRSIEADDLEYSEQNGCYYVPFNFINSLYQPVIDTVRRSGGKYQVKVAYVSINDLQVDEHGNTIDPTPDMASFSQVYVLDREDGHFVVTAVGEESGTAAAS